MILRSGVIVKGRKVNAFRAIAISEELKSLIELQVIDTAIADLNKAEKQASEIINEARQFLTASHADLLNVKTSYDNLLK